MTKRKRIYKPRTDDQFLAQIAFIRFVSGFKHSLVDKKWPYIEKAFEEFKIEKLAKYSDKDIECIMKAEGMIKNRRKINDIVSNAKICQTLAKEHGSVLKWIQKNKKLAEDPMINPTLAESFQIFAGIGETTSGWLENLHGAKKNHITVIVPGT